MRVPRLLAMAAITVLVFFAATADVFAVGDSYYSLAEVAYTVDGTTADRLQPETIDYKFNYGEEESVTFPLPWAFNFYGTPYTQITADTNGNIWFDAAASAHSFSLPTTGPAIAAWNTDLNSYYQGGVFVQHKTGPERIVVQWRSETFPGAGYGRANDFEVVLFQDGTIRFDYKSFDGNAASDFGSGISRGDGVNYLSVTDSFGDVPTLSGRSFRFDPDRTPPSLSVNSVTSPTLAPGQTLSGTMETGASVSVSVDTTATAGAVSYPTSTTWECLISGLAEGTNSFTVTATDVSGNATVGAPLPVITYHADTDGDGLPDYWETANGLNPADPGDAALDGDGDGLSNADEYLAETNPAVADSDGDGVVDGQDLFPTEAVAASVSPTNIDSDEKTEVELAVTYLSAPGASILVRQAVDLNANGTADAGEPVVRSFSVTDGVASSNPNVQGDEDGAADGAITTTLNYLNTLDLYHAPAGYVFQVTAGPVSTQAALAVQPAVEPQTISGLVTDGLNPVPGALVRITDKWGRSVGAAIADSTGQYLIDLKNPGEYYLTPMSYGLVAAKSGVPLVNLTAGQNLNSINLVLSAGTHQLSGKVVDDTTSTGIDGIWVVAESVDHVGLAISNSLGEYALALPAGDYQVQVSPREGPVPAFKGWLSAPGQTVALSGDQSEVDLRLPQAAVLVGGRITNELGAGLPGVPVKGVSADGMTEAVAATNSQGDYTLGMIPGNGWTIGLAEQMEYVGTQLSGLAVSEPVSGQDLSARQVNAWIRGTVKDTENAPMAGVHVSGTTAEGFQQKVVTAADGTYLLAAFPGTWQISADTQAQGCEPVSEQQATITLGQTAVADFAGINGCAVNAPDPYFGQCIYQFPATPNYYVDDENGYFNIAWNGTIVGAGLGSGSTDPFGRPYWDIGGFRYTMGEWMNFDVYYYVNAWEVCKTNVGATPPATPTSLSVPTSSTTGSYTVTWGASPTAGATYRLEEATDSAFTSGLRTVVGGTTSLSAAITGRSAGLTYYYRVRAEKDGLSSGWLTGGGCYIGASMPGSISIPIASSTDSYAVSWGASPTAGVTYRLEEATDSAFTNGLRTVVSDMTSLSAAISGRATGVTYYYRVRAEIDGVYSAWRNGTNGCVVDFSQPIGVWIYRWDPTPTPYAYFAFDDFEQSWEIVWGYSGYYYYSNVISGTDSLGREYYNADGYRYTRGRTLVEQFEENGWDWNMYKICKTPIGVQCTGNGD